MRSGWSSAAVIAALTWKRLFRGRAVWISALIAAVPIAFAYVMRTYGNDPRVANDVLAFEALLLVVIPPMFVASSIGEDIEDRTTTYVWSRPVPRWAVLAGKLLALAPLVAFLLVASWNIAVLVGDHVIPPARSTAGLAAGAIVCCFAAAALATLVPKHGMALTIAFMLFFDLPVGVMPIRLAELSITHNLRIAMGMLSNIEGTLGGAATGLAVLGAVWLGIALWRIRRLEA